jgi:membrane protein
MASTKSNNVQKPESLWKLGGLTFWRLTKNVIRESMEDRLLERASGLAFDFFLALFPMLVFLLSLFGLFASRSSQLQSSLLGYFADFLPPAGFEILRKFTEELAMNASSGKLTFGILVAIWFASGGVVSMISTLNLIHHATETRSWFKVRATALVLLLFLSVLILAALFIVFLGGHIAEWTGKELYLSSAIIFVWKELQWPAATLFMVVSYSLIYYFGPDLPERRWHWISPGTAFGVLLWLAASAGFRIYLHYFNTYTATYGSLGALTVLLVWLYVTGLAFLVGGEVDAQIERAARQIRQDDWKSAV